MDRSENHAFNCCVLAVAAISAQRDASIRHASGSAGMMIAPDLDLEAKPLPPRNALTGSGFRHGVQTLKRIYCAVHRNSATRLDGDMPREGAIIFSATWSASSTCSTSSATSAVDADGTASIDQSSAMASTLSCSI